MKFTNPLKFIRPMATLAPAFLMAVTAFSLPAQAEEEFLPSWMKPDAEAKTVDMDIVSGFNGNSGALNFNGYYEGNATIVVPVGWKVKVAFRNQDGNIPHSMAITEPYAEDDFPLDAGPKAVAIKRAYSRSPITGQSATEKPDTVKFKTKKAGDYYLFCGVTAHGQAGMWIHFKVSDTAEGPSLIVGDDSTDGRK